MYTIQLAPKMLVQLSGNSLAKKFLKAGPVTIFSTEGLRASWKAYLSESLTKLETRDNRFEIIALPPQGIPPMVILIVLLNNTILL